MKYLKMIKTIVIYILIVIAALVTRILLPLILHVGLKIYSRPILDSISYLLVFSFYFYFLNIKAQVYSDIVDFVNLS
ncbi:MAG TPA: hypothetical protein DDW65_22170 [Firmicutes bacterium]|nr:hypothetical protein [Bacillota bacterium]